MNRNVVLPSSIKPYVFTNLAWDNIDRLEEALTGYDTSHRVNGIDIQPNVYGQHLPRVDHELPLIEKQKQICDSGRSRHICLCTRGTCGSTTTFNNIEYSGKKASVH
jgi:hypothetical protein